MADDKTTTTPTPCLQGMPAGPHEDPPTGTKETLPQRGTQRSNAVAFLGNWSRGYALKILIAAVLRNKTHNQRHNAFEKWIQHTKTKIKTADLAACTVHTFLVEALRKWQCLRTINNEHRNTKNACGVLNARLNTQKKTLHFSCPHTENVTFRDPAYLCFRKGVKTTFLKKVLKYKVLKLSQGSGFFSFPVPFIQSFPWSCAAECLHHVSGAASYPPRLPPERREIQCKNNGRTCAEEGKSGSSTEPAQTSTSADVLAAKATMPMAFGAATVEHAVLSVDSLH
jgi:hypothetical protein